MTFCSSDAWLWKQSSSSQYYIIFEVIYELNNE